MNVELKTWNHRYLLHETWPWPFLFFPNLNTPIGHFRVLLCLWYKTSLSAKPFIWKWVLHAVSFSCKTVIFIRMVSRLDSLWNKGTKELGNGVLRYHHPPSTHLSPLNFTHPSLLPSVPWIIRQNPTTNGNWINYKTTNVKQNSQLKTQSQ